MITPEFNIIFSFISSFFITFLAIPKVIFLAQHLRLIDLPGERSSHKGKIPVFGGIAIFSGLIFSLLLWAELENIQFILVSLVIVFFMGVIDDLLALSPIRKLIGQIIAILIIIFLQDLRIDTMHGVLGIYNLSPMASILFTVFVFIVITNSFNLIDGVDGLAGGIGVISSIGFGFMGFLMGQYNIAILSFTLTGALIAFLRYNYYPAQIFMGDTGSMVVGMILSVLAINSVREGIIIDSTYLLLDKGPLFAIALLALPLFDCLRVFLNRVLKGKSPLSAGKDHLHHILLDLNLGHERTTYILCFSSIVTIIISFFLLSFNLTISIIILSFISYSFISVPFFISRKRLK